MGFGYIAQRKEEHVRRTVLKSSSQIRSRFARISEIFQ